ncbi:MAG TPA: hypothetical protein VG274_05100, partial [Rhizomicrobium sp.]|nr:hypothetical protein [Rhizomicrobium sp.]
PVSRQKESIMRLVPVTISAVALCASIAFGEATASADEARPSSCPKLASEVNDALASNAQSANYEAAVKEKRYGLEFCANGLYRNGAEHYAEALKLLGASKG